MPVQIGAKTHNFSDPTGLLSDCHRRIEMFLGVARGDCGGDRPSRLGGNRPSTGVCPALLRPSSANTHR
jgi:hypothetical protein